MPVMQINIGDHVSPESGFVAFPVSKRNTMRWARTKAISIAKNNPRANVYFRSITTGSRSLSQIVADNSLWINYNPSLTDFGETAGASGFSKECAIGPSAFRKGRWMVLATLIHELAHCNGAAGGSATTAEDALPHCGLGSMKELRTGVDDPRTPYEPGLGG